MSGPANAGSTNNQDVQDEIRRLGAATGSLVEALRAQRDILRQRGMGLPPGTLNGLRTVQTDLENLARKLQVDAQELDQLRALTHTTALITSSLDLDTVLNEVMDTVIGLTNAERGYIVLRNDQTDEMEFRIARNMDRQTIDEGSFIVSRTVVQQVTETGQPVVTTNAQSDPHWGAQESVVIHALRSILCVPLMVKGRVTGAVYADNRVRDSVFGDKELTLLLTFANQAATAIENARLFQSVQDTLDEITEMKELMDNVFASIASGVITINLDQVITTYNQAAERILGAPAQGVLGQPLHQSVPVIHDPVYDLLDAIYNGDYQGILELEPELPLRGPVNLNLKISPLKNQDATEGAAIVVDDLTEIKKRDATLNVVRRYLSPVMVDNIQSIDGLGLGGERRFVTVLFVEVRPFSTFPAGLRAGELMERLNLYLTAGAETINNHGGVIDKFMGNEIMALFNTQLNPSEQHAWQAVLAALRMAEEFLKIAPQFGEAPIAYHRFGINTGVATIGNVGSSSRREFTAIGDTINLGKRLQENAAPGQIIIGEDVFQQCQTEFADHQHGVEALARDAIQVKGLRRSVRIYEIKRRP